MTKTLPLESIRIDGETQARVKIDDDVVADYAEIIQESSGDWPFPPVDVFCDGTDHFMADGFHRHLAAKRAGRESIPVTEHTGTAYDARVFGMTANDTHGLRMTRADKRACVEWLLDQPGKMTQKEIAEKAGVDPSTVKRIVAERNEQSVAGKVTPPKWDGKGSMNPSTPISGGSAPFEDDEPEDEESTVDYGKCPNCAGTEWDEDDDGVCCSKCYHPWGEPVGDVDSKTRKGRKRDVWEAQQVIKTWMDAVGRWMNGNPDGIDQYREKFPGPKGDRVIETAKAFFNALDAWKKGLK